MEADRVSTVKAEILRSVVAARSPEVTTPQGQGEAGQGSAPITKIEAVRRAIAALGTRAHPDKIQAYIKDNFSIDMEVDRISTVKAEVLRKARQKRTAQAKQEKGPDPAHTSAKGPESTVPQGQGEAGQGGEPMTKIEAVRRAVEALGPRAHRGEIWAYIIDNFGLDIALDRISTIQPEVRRTRTNRISEK
jgi:hypothetical protein